jgi:hypothetical protein
MAAFLIDSQRTTSLKSAARQPVSAMEQAASKADERANHGFSATTGGPRPHASALEGIGCSQRLVQDGQTGRRIAVADVERWRDMDPIAQDQG